MRDEKAEIRTNDRIDKDGDGKLNPEERKAAMAERAALQEKAVKERKKRRGKGERRRKRKRKEEKRFPIPSKSI